MSVTSRDIRTPLPGHVIINIALAAGVWGIGVALTAQSIPSISGWGPYIPWLLAGLLQLLLSAAQANLKVMGITLDTFPLFLLFLVDIALNTVGLLLVYADLDGLMDVGRYIWRAGTGGPGLWQCLLALGVGGLIATVPEKLLRAALKR